jgi:hypothetical protein
VGRVMHGFLGECDADLSDPIVQVVVGAATVDIEVVIVKRVVDAVVRDVTVCVEVGAVAVTEDVEVETDKQEHALEIRDAGYIVELTWYRQDGAGEVTATARAVMVGRGLVSWLKTTVASRFA